MGEYDSSQWKTNYSYVFINGLMGWGQYDAQYKAMPYWGVFGGELKKELNAKGYDCYAASVAGTASASIPSGKFVYEILTKQVTE